MSQRVHYRPTPETLLAAYANGIFPMAERRDSKLIHWISPDERGIIPFESFHVPRRLARTVRSDRFTVTANRAFRDVMEACAMPASDREETWINDELLHNYTALHTTGYAHSIECWQDDALVGGLYGVQLGAAFFGESMFSRARDASKVALVHLMARLIHGGFVLLDTQFLTNHLAAFGAIAIPRAAYMARLEHAISQQAVFYSPESYSPESYSPESLGTSGTGSFAPLSGDTGFTGAVEATGGANCPGWLVLQLITQTS